MRWPSRAIVAWLLAALASTHNLVAGTEPAESPESPAPSRLVDRILAVVDDDPILASDVARAIQLGLAEPKRETESDDTYRARILEAMIDQRLRQHEVERFGLVRVPVEEIEREAELVRSEFPTEEAYRAALEIAQLDEAGLKQLVARKLALDRYVNERLGAKVFVSRDEAKRTYEESWAPSRRAQGLAVPPFEDVVEQVRAEERTNRMNEEIARWTDELRERADIIDLSDETHDRLPPLVDRIVPP